MPRLAHSGDELIVGRDQRKVSPQGERDVDAVVDWVTQVQRQVQSSIQQEAALGKSDWSPSEQFQADGRFFASKVTNLDFLPENVRTFNQHQIWSFEPGL